MIEDKPIHQSPVTILNQVSSEKREMSQNAKKGFDKKAWTFRTKKTESLCEYVFVIKQNHVKTKTTVIEA